MVQRDNVAIERATVPKSRTVRLISHGDKILRHKRLRCRTADGSDAEQCDDRLATLRGSAHNVHTFALHSPRPARTARAG